MMKLFEDDHYPQKLLWVLVPCNWKNRIGTENEGRTDITLAEFTALIRPEIIYVQRPTTFTQAIQNYMTIAEGSFISHGLKLREMSCEVQHEVCAAAINYAIPCSKNTEDVIDSKFVFEINIIISQIDQKKQIRSSEWQNTAKLIRTCHTVGLSHVACSDERTKDYCVHEPEHNVESAIELSPTFGVDDVVQVSKKLQVIIDQQKNIKKIDVTLMNQPFNIIESSVGDMQVYRDFIQLIASQDFKYIVDENLPIEEPDDEDTADYSLVPENLQQFMHYSLQYAHIDKDAHKFSKRRQEIVQNARIMYHGVETEVLEMRGIVYSEILGDILFFVKLNAAF